MTLITEEYIKQSIKSMWDSVLLIQDDELKSFAAHRVSTKEKELRSSMKHQKEVLNMLNEDFAAYLEMFVSEPIREKLADTTDEETADDAIDELYKFIELLKSAI